MPSTDAKHDYQEFEAAVAQAAGGIGVSLAESHIAAMWRHFEAVVRQNKVMNLTRITDPAGAAVKHCADSLALVAWATQSGASVHSVLDVGTGAGFPAVPLAIVRPDWQVTAIDGTRKKIDFVRRCAAELSLTNLHAEHAHASHWNTPDRFDVVTMRAVTKLADAIDMCARFIGAGGALVMFKAAKVEESEAAKARAAAQQHLMSESTFTYELTGGASALRRSLYTYRMGR